MRITATIADAAGIPIQIRMLNKGEPLLVGQISDDGNNLSSLLAKLLIEPTGSKPMCKHIRNITEQVKEMESNLLGNRTIALLTIITDGASTDGHIIEALKPLEGMPIQIMIRLYTEEEEVLEYWQDVSAHLDLDIIILRGHKAESHIIAEHNKWLTYGEPMHRLREFGVLIPAVNSLGSRQLSRREIKTVAQIV